MKKKVNKQLELFPIHCTIPGPDFGKPAVVHGYKDEGDKHFMTHNPIPEGKTFKTTYKGKTVIFKVEMNWYTNLNLVLMEVLHG